MHAGGHMSISPKDQHLSSLQQKLSEYERALADKNLYLAKLEMDLEHAIIQCKKFAAERLNACSSNPNQWIHRHEPGLDHKG